MKRCDHVVRSHHEWPLLFHACDEARRTRCLRPRSAERDDRLHERAREHRVREPTRVGLPGVCVKPSSHACARSGSPSELVKHRPRRGVRDDSGAAVVLSSVGTGRRTLYFSGHYDVVPVVTPGQCEPVLRGEALFGRGSADMKGGLASMLYAAVALQRLRVPLDGRVGLVFVPDEETGGRRGSGFSRPRSVWGLPASACSHPSPRFVSPGVPSW
jgi:succinyl-diaminopimelate desuccinylase